LAADDDGLRKLLKECKEPKSYADKMPYKKKLGVSKITIVKTPSGDPVYSEEKEVKINLNCSKCGAEVCASHVRPQYWSKWVPDPYDPDNEEKEKLISGTETVCVGCAGGE
jgi:hypothetical protein